MCEEGYRTAKLKCKTCAFVNKVTARRSLMLNICLCLKDDRIKSLIIMWKGNRKKKIKCACEKSNVKTCVKGRHTKVLMWKNMCVCVKATARESNMTRACMWKAAAPESSAILEHVCIKAAAPLSSTLYKFFVPISYRWGDLSAFVEFNASRVHCVSNLPGAISSLLSSFDLGLCTWIFRFLFSYLCPNFFTPADIYFVCHFALIIYLLFMNLWGFQLILWCRFMLCNMFKILYIHTACGRCCKIIAGRWPFRTFSRPSGSDWLGRASPRGKA